MAVDPFSAFINTDGAAFPNNAAVNSTGAGLFDGTEFVALYVNNFGFGRQQALLDFSNIIPSGSAEVAGASQELEAIRKGFNVGAGFMEMSCLNVTETAKYRLLPLNGQGILRASYADLDTATYVGDATNTAVQLAGGGFYRADDAAGTIPNIVGVYLILPESRGYTPRGLDVAAAVDPLGATRVLGDNQGFNTEDLYAQVHIAGATSKLYIGGVVTPSWASTRSAVLANGAEALAGFLAGSDVQPLGTAGSETRMTNISTNFVVGY